jgi:hypothetical protein
MFVAFKEIYDDSEKAMKKRNIVPVVQLLAFAPETWDDLMNYKDRLENKGASLGGLQPFLDRFKVWTIFQLDHLSIPTDVRELIVELLKLGKTPNPNVGKEDPIYPFEEKAIEFLADRSLGIPRYAMEYAYHCLERADEEQVKITRDNALRWIREYIGATGEEGEPAELEGNIHETEERLE